MSSSNSGREWQEKQVLCLLPEIGPDGLPVGALINFPILHLVADDGAQLTTSHL
jgi:hypothetical protein